MTKPSGTPGGLTLPEPYPFDPFCGHVPMTDVGENIRSAIGHAIEEVRLEMRMLGHVRDINPADQRTCLDILAALEQLYSLGQRLP